MASDATEERLLQTARSGAWRLVHGRRGRTKRVLDIAIVCLGAPVVLALIGVTSLLVLVFSGRPIFYRARRIGRGRSFFMLKFRTMLPDAEAGLAQIMHLNASDGGMVRIPNDPRVTRIGGILRRTGLDELPQIVNVFRGEMSLVGPRPHDLQDLQDLQVGDSTALIRMQPRPGITGLWQITERRDHSLSCRVNRDLQYLSRSSLLLDIFIVLMTPLVLAHPLFARFSRAVVQLWIGEPPRVQREVTRAAVDWPVEPPREAVLLRVEPLAG